MMSYIKEKLFIKGIIDFCLHKVDIFGNEKEM